MFTLVGKVFTFRISAVKTSEMPKPIVNSSTGCIKRLLYANTATFLVVVCVLCVGPYVTAQLSVIASVKVVVQVLCCYLLAANLVLTASLRDVDLPPYKSQRTAKVRKLFCNIVELLLSSFVFHVIAVLFGAPFVQSASETFHFACLLTAATVLPCMCVIGPSVATWLNTWMWDGRSATVEWSCFISGLAAVIGAWLGAFPIPLDWDRPWQLLLIHHCKRKYIVWHFHSTVCIFLLLVLVWPVSCVLGTLAGYCVGLLGSSLFLLHRLRTRRKSKSG